MKQCGVAFKFPGNIEWSSEVPLIDIDLKEGKHIPVR